ncbi:MAG: UDP-N-acetylmuramate--L-alanine ligase, partial [Myxococcales bacterium]
GEEPIPGATGEALADAIRAFGHHDVTFVPNKAELAQVLKARVQPGDLAMTLGAGDITNVGPELLALLKEDGR